jgi:hypothetical protein
MSRRSRQFEFLSALLAAAAPFALGGCSDDPITGPGATSSETNPPVEDPGHLEPPPAGQGFQMQTADIQIAPGEEIQDCYFFRIRDLATAGGLPGDKSVNLHRVQIGQREGSHHMNVFRVKTIVPDGFTDFTKDPVQHGKNGMGACFKSPLWADWPLIANSQQDGHLDWTYPDGVANELLPDDWIMLQTHYVNATSQQTPDVGHVSVNFWNMPDAEVTAQLGTMFATKQSIRICESVPGPQTFEGGCHVKDTGKPVNVIGANGHFHSRGKKFDMYSWNGLTNEQPDEKAFYESTSWNEPPMSHSPELDFALPPGGGVFYTCTFEWEQPDPAVGCEGLHAYDKDKLVNAKVDPKTPEEADAMLDCCYRFGPIVEKNEHCNAFVYYYPKQDDVICF